MDRGKVGLTFLWHMHQPIYKDGIGGEYKAPWVFLHGIKDYYDMPYHLSKFSKLKAVFNLTPSLIVQLKDYAKGGKDCLFLKSLRKEVKSLSRKEKLFLLKFLFKSPLKTMISTLKEYFKLYVQREKLSEEEFIDRITNQDFLNLQVLFLLSWCGNYLRENSNLVKGLIEKGNGFSEKEKLKLIEELTGFIGKILPLYRKMQEEGRIEISTTPFYHPILPLLLKIESAKEATPWVKLPGLHISFKEDAEEQLRKALLLYREEFGRECRGIWPAEGGISEECIELFGKFKVKWSASDEEVLLNSLELKEREKIYRCYKFKGVKLLFRDRELSDLIGFTYHDLKEEEAVNDFIGRLREKKGKQVAVILDGENCWEFYNENGWPFRELLYKRLEEEDWIETLLPSEIEEKEELGRIRAGSWVNGNFLVWIGSKEKNRAWELLGKTKSKVEEKKKSRGYIRAKEKILTAEGSDWFWWLDENRQSEESQLFESLFRSFLIGALKEVEEEPDYELLNPLIKVESRDFPPNNYIKPTIDGEITNYYEWLNAGKVKLSNVSTMERSERVIKELLYGYDEEGNLYLLIKGEFGKLKGKELSFKLVFLNSAQKEIEPKEFKVKKVAEIKIPAEEVKEFLGKKAKLLIKLFVNGKLFEEAPLMSFALLELDRNFSEEWIV
ncbi:glycoside hydrolase family 57 protein [Thermovibrio sp.]